MDRIEQAYQQAKEIYSGYGVDVDQAVEALKKLRLSIHCWQGDDVGGFETPDAALGGGGIQVTGNFPGKARTIDELKSDLNKLLGMVPGKHRLNLHASYGDFGGKKIGRDEVETEHFAGWADWANSTGTGLDFNSTFFSHPLADDGFTLSSKIAGTRDFWIEHAKRCREISAFLGKQTGSSCIHNIWIPDGTKDYAVDRIGHRKILMDSLDDILAKEIGRASCRERV